MIADGFMIHDALKISRAKIETRVFSMTASAATIIAQSGDIRKMSSNALYLVHKSSNIVWGNANELRSQVDLLEKVDERIKDVYVKKGAKKKRIDELMEEDNGNGKWIDAEEALSIGLIDEIMEPTRATAMMPQEYFNKYKLPKIPDNLMNKLNLNPEVTSDAGTKDKKGIIASTIGLLTELIKGDKDPQDKVEVVSDEVAETPVDVVPEIVSDPVLPDIVPEPVPEPENVKNPDVEALQSQLMEMKAEIADLKKSLGDAQTALAKAGAKSTIITGPTGKEGDTFDDEQINPEVKKTLGAISKVMNGASLESPKKEKPEPKEDHPEK